MLWLCRLQLNSGALLKTWIHSWIPGFMHQTVTPELFSCQLLNPGNMAQDLWPSGCWQLDLWSGSFAFSKSSLNIWCKALLSPLCWVNLSPWHHIWLHLSFVLLHISQKPDTFSRGEIQKLLESDSRGQIDSVQWLLHTHCLILWATVGVTKWWTHRRSSSHFTEGLRRHCV